MARPFCRAFLAAAWLFAWVAGCTKQMTTKQTKPPPPDPLLMSKKPIEGRPGEAEQTYTAHFDPTPPPPPTRPTFSNGSQSVAPGWQRDPITGVQIGLQAAENDSGNQPATQTKMTGRP